MSSIIGASQGRANMTEKDLTANTFSLDSPRHRKLAFIMWAVTGFGAGSVSYFQEGTEQ
jgi:hypothetical protein